MSIYPKITLMTTMVYLVLISCNVESDFSSKRTRDQSNQPTPNPTKSESVNSPNHPIQDSADQAVEDTPELASEPNQSQGTATDDNEQIPQGDFAEAPVSIGGAFLNSCRFFVPDQNGQDQPNVLCQIQRQEQEPEVAAFQTLELVSARETITIPEDLTIFIRESKDSDFRPITYQIAGSSGTDFWLNIEIKAIDQRYFIQSSFNYEGDRRETGEQAITSEDSILSKILTKRKPEGHNQQKEDPPPPTEQKTCRNSFDDSAGSGSKYFAKIDFNQQMGNNSKPIAGLPANIKFYTAIAPQININLFNIRPNNHITIKLLDIMGTNTHNTYHSRYQILTENSVIKTIDIPEIANQSSFFDSNIESASISETGDFRLKFISGVNIDSQESRDHYSQNELEKLKAIPQESLDQLGDARKLDWDDYYVKTIVMTATEPFCYLDPKSHKEIASEIGDGNQYR